MDFWKSPWNREFELRLRRQSGQSTVCNSTIVSRSERLGYKRAEPSGLAELEHLHVHVESNSEGN